MSINLQLMSRDRSCVCSHLPADSDPCSQSTDCLQSPEILFFFKAAVLTPQRVPDFHLMSYSVIYPYLLIAWKHFSMTCFQSRSGIIP